MGIAVAPPDVNASDVEFTPREGTILFGLSAIKGCGRQAAEAIAAERQARGPFRDLFDLCGRVDGSVVNKTALENLTKAGGLDSLLPPAGHRAALLAGIERAVAAGAARLADRKSGQKNLFAAFEEAEPAAEEPVATLPDVPPLTDMEMRSFEKEVLGYYVHSHPLAEYRSILQAVCTHGSAEVGHAEPRSEVVMGGLVGAVKLSNTKQPRPGSTFTRYGMFDLEDMDGLVRSICWPEEYARVGERLTPDAVVVVAGTVDRRAGSEETNLIINEIVPIADVWSRPVRSVHLKILEEAHDRETLDRLRDLLARHAGETPVRLIIELADGRRALLEIDGVRVGWSQQLLAELEALLGGGAVRAQAAIAGGRREERQPRGRRANFQPA